MSDEGNGPGDSFPVPPPSKRKPWWIRLRRFRGSDEGSIRDYEADTKRRVERLLAYFQPALVVISFGFVLVASFHLLFPVSCHWLSEDNNDWWRSPLLLVGGGYGLRGFILKKGLGSLGSGIEEE